MPVVSPILELQRQRALLQLEYKHEREEFRRLTEVMGVGRKVKRGDCWYPLRVGRSYYNSLNQLVLEVMRTDDLPIIPEDTHLGKAIIEVSRGKLGLGVSLDDGKVTGLITDGDIRRAMEKWQAEFFDRTVADIMTRTPKCVSPTTKITEIQKIMQTNKIHTVLVVDDCKHLLGVVDHYSCMV